MPVQPRKVAGPCVLVLLAAALVAAAVLVGPVPSPYRYERVADPARTLVRDRSGHLLAVLTDRSRTAVFTGRRRTFAEPRTTNATVTTSAWVRLAPRPWRAPAAGSRWFRRWFSAALRSSEPDILALALHYSRDAIYGPTIAGERLEASDFNDYLGIDWRYPDGRVRPAKPGHFGALDCSGLVRMVYGYRAGFPLEIGAPSGRALPRRAFAMASYAPGTVLIPDTGERPPRLGALAAGDLVFFDADPDDGPRTDHVGIYLGLDSSGHHRFLSSRKTANGPTMGDTGGASLLDGDGLYARTFRTARRL